MTEDSDLDLFDKMSALEFSFELLVANERADTLDKPRAQSRPKARVRGTKPPPTATARSKPRRRVANPAAKIG